MNGFVWIIRNQIVSTVLHMGKNIYIIISEIERQDNRDLMNKTGVFLINQSLCHLKLLDNAPGHRGKMKK